MSNARVQRNPLFLDGGDCGVIVIFERVFTAGWGPSTEEDHNQPGSANAATHKTQPQHQQEHKLNEWVPCCQQHE